MSVELIEELVGTVQEGIDPADDAALLAFEYLIQLLERQGEHLARLQDIALRHLTQELIYQKSITETEYECCSLPDPTLASTERSPLPCAA